MSTSSTKKVKGFYERKPSWIRMEMAGKKDYYQVKSNLKLAGLHTVCEEARCPNIGECWATGTATIMILGDTCTRACKFCNVKTGNPRGVVDDGEPSRVGKIIAESGLKYIVITCVDRDDLPDGGADIFKRTVEEIKVREPGIKVETLISDYSGNEAALANMLDGKPDVLAHNLETVESLTSLVRDKRASYEQSLNVLKNSKRIAPQITTKSSLMVGFGETMEELKDACKHLRDVGVDVLTFGQYLRPSPRHISVKRYYFPEEFQELKLMAEAMGFLFVASGAMVRSSYKAAELFLEGHLK